MSSLLKLSIQNMMTLVSVNLMLFMDRIILARHSIDSLNAAVTAGSVCNIFIFGAIALVGIGDVFIGQYYGAGRTEKIGEILWQMIWFCVALAVSFFILSRVLSIHLFPVSEGQALSATYFTWQLSLGFLPVLIAAFTSFFVGTKRFGFALMAALIASGVKLLLEFPLVFGVDGLFVGLGIKGAIIATAISQSIHLIILASVIIKKSNRARFGSLNWRFRPALFIDCIRLGLPQSIGMMLNYTAWGIVIGLLSAAGQRHLMMYTIIDSTYNLLSFATEALQKSVLALSANLIGSGKASDTSKIFYKALRLLFPIMLLLSIPLLFFPSVVALGFDVDVNVLSSKEISLACLVIWLYFGFDGLNWILSGLLTAMGDTLFVNPINGLTSFVSVLATYLMTVTTKCLPEVTCWVSIIYGVLSCSLLYLRYQRHRRDNYVHSMGKEFLTSPLSPLPSLYQAAHSKPSVF